MVAPLAAAVRDYDLDRHQFERLIESREADLDDTPWTSLAALDAYAEASSSPLVALALAVLGVRDDAAQAVGREVGIGYALAGLIRAMPFRARAGRPLIPEDVAAEAGLDPWDRGGLRASPALRQATAILVEAALRHLAAARAGRRRVPRRAVPALLPAVIAERALRRFARAHWDPFDQRLLAPDPSQIWRLAWAALLGWF